MCAMSYTKLDIACTMGVIGKLKALSKKHWGTIKEYYGTP